MITLPFTDVPAGNGFFCSIAEAYFSALTNGTSPATFSPATGVTREQMAAFINQTGGARLLMLRASDLYRGSIMNQRHPHRTIYCRASTVNQRP